MTRRPSSVKKTVGHKNHARNQALQTCESIQRDYPEPISPFKSACLKKITIRIALRLKTLREKTSDSNTFQAGKSQGIPTCNFHQQHPVPELLLAPSSSVIPPYTAVPFLCQQYHEPQNHPPGIIFAPDFRVTKMHNLFRWC